MKIVQNKDQINRKKIHHDPGGYARCKDSITIKKSKVCESRRKQE